MNIGKITLKIFLPIALENCFRISLFGYRGIELYKQHFVHCLVGEETHITSLSKLSYWILPLNNKQLILRSIYLRENLKQRELWPCPIEKPKPVLIYCWNMSAQKSPPNQVSHCCLHYVFIYPWLDVQFPSFGKPTELRPSRGPIPRHNLARWTHYANQGDSTFNI